MPELLLVRRLEICIRLRIKNESPKDHAQGLCSSQGTVCFPPSPELTSLSTDDEISVWEVGIVLEIGRAHV